MNLCMRDTGTVYQLAVCLKNGLVGWDAVGWDGEGWEDESELVWEGDIAVAKLEGRVPRRCCGLNQ